MQRTLTRRRCTGAFALSVLLVAFAVPVGAQPVETRSADAPDASPAAAEPANPDSGAFEGAWVGVGGAFALEHFDRPGAYDDSGALAFRAGYRGLPNVAVELLGEVLPEFEADGAPDGDLDGYLVTANAKLFLPLGRLEPWAMAGVGFLYVDPKYRRADEDLALRFASGVDWVVAPNWVIYVEAAYVLPTGQVEDYAYSTYGAGVLFRF